MGSRLGKRWINATTAKGGNVNNTAALLRLKAWRALTYRYMLEKQRGRDRSTLPHSDVERLTKNQLYNVLDKRVGQASEWATPPTLRTFSSVHLNHVKR